MCAIIKFKNTKQKFFLCNKKVSETRPEAFVVTDANGS